MFYDCLYKVTIKLFITFVGSYGILLLIDMDIDFLSRMLKELLLDNDKVCLPGLGTFVAEMVPSVISDKGYTINPPYRKLYFREVQNNDNLMVRMYASSNGISEAVAEEVLTAFISEMKEVLNREKTIVFPELGRLRATKENNYFFVAAEDMDIFPDGIGLEPVSLKAHRMSLDTDSNPVAGTDDVARPEFPEPGTSVSATDAQETAEKEASAEPEARSEVPGAGKAWKTVLAVSGVLLALAALALLLFVVLAHLCPDFIDSILYTDEELEILRYNPGL